MAAASLSAEIWPTAPAPARHLLDLNSAWRDGSTSPATWSGPGVLMVAEGVAQVTLSAKHCPGSNGSYDPRLRIDRLAVGSTLTEVGVLA